MKLSFTISTNAIRITKEKCISLRKEKHFYKPLTEQLYRVKPSSLKPIVCVTICGIQHAIHIQFRYLKCYMQNQLSSHIIALLTKNHIWPLVFSKYWWIFLILMMATSSGRLSWSHNFLLLTFRYTSLKVWYKTFHKQPLWGTPHQDKK